MATLDRIEIVADDSAKADPTQGFLRLRRLTLQNRYADGSTSEPYPCDIVSRRFPDAVAIVIYEIDDARQVRVAMRTGVRPPVYFRGDQPGLVQPETRDHRLLTEIVAGLLETGDDGPDGIDRRAADECIEEAGYDVPVGDVQELGAPMFPSPGVTDEQIFYRRVETDLDARGAPKGDGSTMEEAGDVVLMPLDEAIHRCRAGDIPDAKTELALLRLCDAIGYNLQLARFVKDLPPHVQPPGARLRWLSGERSEEG